MTDVRPDSNKNRFRAARIAKLKLLVGQCLSERSKCRILDIGGTYGFWNVWRNELDWNTTEVVCVNLNPAHADEGKQGTNITMIKGDARHLPQIADGEFDIVFSNSVIEHVGLWRDMQSMANEIRRVGKHHLVQTPNYWFPIEPHARTPFLHWLPEPLAYRIVMWRKCGFWSKAKTVSDAVATVQSAKMIDFNQMQSLFPDSQIERERFLGFTKSLIAISP
jgi:SAM-dependent methyltransferase